MALTISQALSVSFPKVLNLKRKPTNQWSENAFMREMERVGAIIRESLGPTIEATLDYRRNPGAGFHATDLDPTPSTKTEVLTAASYSPAQLSVPITWSKMDEATNTGDVAKVKLVKTLLENGIDSHDDLIEEALFAATSTDGFHSLAVLIPTSGQGSPGGIPADTETFWRNPSDTYLADGSDIEAVFTSLYNDAAKGSGSSIVTKFMIGGSEPHALFESTQVGLQRWIDTDEAKVGFKVLGFKTARFSFSQYGDTKVYFGNPKSLQLIVSKEFFRHLGETIELEGPNGYKRKLYTALQFVTDNKSRLAVADEA